MLLIDGKRFGRGRVVVKIAMHGFFAGLAELLP
jgi:hypothetical protein